jgi:hypothetical protein
MDASRELDRLLNDIEIGCDPPVGGPECNRFSLDCLALIRYKLPPVALEGLACVTEYLAGQLTLQSVTDMRIKCWQYLDENYKHAPLDDPMVSAVRAVICPLHAQQNPDERNIVDHLSFFLMLVNNVEPHFQEEESLLRAYFAHCLKLQLVQ